MGSSQSTSAFDQLEPLLQQRAVKEVHDPHITNIFTSAMRDFHCAAPSTIQIKPSSY
jgi:hypothetical protein